MQQCDGFGAVPGALKSPCCVWKCRLAVPKEGKDIWEGSFVPGGRAGFIPVLHVAITMWKYKAVPNKQLAGLGQVIEGGVIGLGPGVKSCQLAHSDPGTLQPSWLWG